MPTKQRIAAVRIVRDAWNAFPDDFVEPHEIKAAEDLVEKALNEARAQGLDRKATAEHVIGTLYADITDPGEDSLLEHYASEHWPETLKFLTDKQHAEQGGATCPYCLSEMIEAHGPADVDGPYATILVECSVCGAAYKDCYTLVGWMEV